MPCGRRSSHFAIVFMFLLSGAVAAALVFFGGFKTHADGSALVVIFLIQGLLDADEGAGLVDPGKGNGLDLNEASRDSLDDANLEGSMLVRGVVERQILLMSGDEESRTEGPVMLVSL